MLLCHLQELFCTSGEVAVSGFKAQLEQVFVDDENDHRHQEERKPENNNDRTLTIVVSLGTNERRQMKLSNLSHDIKDVDCLHYSAD